MPDQKPAPVDYDAIAAGVDYDAIAAGVSGPAPAPARPPSMLDRIEQASSQVIGPTASTVMRGAVDANIGAAKGAAQTVVNIAKLPHMLPGFTRLVDRVYGQKGLGLSDLVTGQQPRSPSADAFAAADQFLAPDGTVQNIWKAGEQIAETVLPGGMVTKLGTRLATMAPRGAQLLTRAGVEAAGAAGIATVQQSDPLVAAGVGAALPVAGRVVSKATGLFRNTNPVLQDAVEWGAQQGIPIDAATATDDAVVRGTQWLADRSIGGALPGRAAGQAREQALVRVGRELADQASPRPVTPEQAGEAISAATTARVGAEGDALASRVFPDPVTPGQAGEAARGGVADKAKAFAAEANREWGRLRGIEAAPSSLRQLPGPVKAVAKEGAKVATEESAQAMFTPAKGQRKEASLFAAVLADAKRQGYKGSPTALKTAFNERMKSASEYLEVMQGENAGRQVLQVIAKHGGLGKVEKDLQGEIDTLWEMTTAARRATKKADGTFAKQQFRESGALAGVPGVVRRAGLTVDQMVERLRADPEFTSQFGEIADNELFDLVYSAAREADSMQASHLEALAQTGVRPGVAWWDDAKAAAQAADDFDPQYLDRIAAEITGEAAPASAAAAVDDVAEAGGEMMAAPVDIRAAKATFGPLMERLKYLMPVAEQRADPGLKAIENILAAPDFMPRELADMNLSAIKELARGKARGASQGFAKLAVRELEKAVQRTVADLGPEAVAARTAGRTATKAEKGADAVLKELREEPVQAFEQLTWAADAGIERLERVAKLTPDALPKVGRALIDKMLASGSWHTWEKLGPKTKALLFPTAKLRADVDRFVADVAPLAREVDGEPVRLFKALTAADDANIEKLRSLARIAPNVGRAYLDDLLGRATAEGGFSRAQGLWADWQKLGPETKRILFPNPDLRMNLGRFFLLAKKAAENPNPSGSALVGSLSAQGYALYASGGVGAVPLILGGAALSKLLHSERGVRLLSKGLETPRRNEATAGAIASQLLKLAGVSAPPDGPAPGDDASRRPGQPPGAPR